MNIVGLARGIVAQGWCFQCHGRGSEVEDTLAASGGPYFLGERFSLVDIMCSVQLTVRTVRTVRSSIHPKRGPRRRRNCAPGAAEVVLPSGARGWELFCLKITSTLGGHLLFPKGQQQSGFIGSLVRCDVH